MKRRRQTELDETLKRWLTAERSHETAGAEAALAELFGSLPRRGPSPGFARRVMLRAGLEAAREVRAQVPWTLRWLAVASLAAVAAAVILLPIALRPLLAATGLGEVGLASLMQAFAAAISFMGQLLASLLALWQKAVAIAAAATGVVDSPLVAALAIISLVMAAFAFRLLDQMIARERSFHHASL